MGVINMDVNKIIEKLGLIPHPGEGGYYRETYRSLDNVCAEALPSRYNHEKELSTAIYYLITPESYSAMHRIPTDEIFHFYLGDPVAMLHLYPDGRGETVILGNDILNGQVLQFVVPGGVWQGMHLIEGGRFALMGTTVAPAFDFDEFELGDRKILIGQYPGFAENIERLTKK